jgi:hypothetical protein
MTVIHDVLSHDYLIAYRLFSRLHRERDGDYELHAVLAASKDARCQMNVAMSYLVMR